MSYDNCDCDACNDEENHEEDEGYMNTSGWACNSCACYEIDGLSNHRSGEDAILAFCKQQLGTPTITASKFKSQLKFTNVVPAHYVFTAGPETSNKYGSNLAKYIEEHALGAVVTLPPRLNLKHHPATTCQVWLWAPDQKALEAWYAPHLDAQIKAAAEAETERLKKIAELEALSARELSELGAIGTIVGRAHHQSAMCKIGGPVGSGAKGQWFVVDTYDPSTRICRFKRSDASTNYITTVDCHLIPGQAYLVAAADSHDWTLQEIVPTKAPVPIVVPMPEKQAAAIVKPVDPPVIKKRKRRIVKAARFVVDNVDYNWGEY